MPGVQGILHVVHGVGDVVGPVHDLLLQAGAVLGGAPPEPVEDLGIVGVVAELLGVVPPGPGVLAGGVQGCAREVKARAASGHRIDDLGLEAREHAQGLRIALESTDVVGDAVEFAFAVVAERRMPQVVGEPRHVDQIGVAAQSGAHLARELGDLQRVG